MYKTIDRFEPQDWDSDILTDSRQLLVYQDEFLAVVFDKLSQDLQWMKGRLDILSNWGYLDNLGRMLWSLEKARQSAEDALSAFLSSSPMLMQQQTKCQRRKSQSE